MPRYLWKASYTTEGVKGVIKDGGTGRRESVQKLIESVGGKMEAFYFAFGDADVYVIADLPDNTSAAAAAITVNGSGAVELQTSLLLTPEEVDAAAKQSADYRPPGG
jgi:uncharacterized protein with GYD domain